jgi:UDP-glucose 4-epimerase
MKFSTPLDETFVAGISGASGFIGGLLSENLSATLKIRPHLGRKSLGNQSTFSGDLSDKEVVSHFVKDLSAVVHLANSNFPRDSKTSLKDDVQNNLIATIQLFEIYARLNPQGHIIFFSSGGTVYDASLPRIPSTEFDRTAPVSSYAIQKLAAEQFLSEICARTGIRGTVFRLSNPYGTPLDLNRSQGVIGIAISCALEEKPFTLFGSAKAVRDYIHMDDVSAAVLKAMESPPQSGDCRILNLGSGEGVETEALLQNIQTTTGKKLEVVAGKIDSREVPWSVLDITKIGRELSWRPQVSLSEGLKRTLSAREKKAARRHD